MWCHRTWQVVVVKRTADRNIGHPRQYWTKGDALACNSLIQEIDLVVARGGIEPPTRGFSVRTQKRIKCLIEEEFIHQGVKYLLPVTRG